MPLGQLGHEGAKRPMPGGDFILLSHFQVGRYVSCAEVSPHVPAHCGGLANTCLPLEKQVGPL